MNLLHHPILFQGVCVCVWLSLVPMDGVLIAILSVCRPLVHSFCIISDNANETQRYFALLSLSDRSLSCVPCDIIMESHGPATSLSLSRTCVSLPEDSTISEAMARVSHGSDRLKQLASTFKYKVCVCVCVCVCFKSLLLIIHYSQ